jgi:hypothetical protein
LDGGVRHLFHLGQIDIQARPLFSKSMSDDDFPPLFGDIPDAV